MMRDDMEQTMNVILAQVLLDPQSAHAAVAALGGEEALREKIGQEIRSLSRELDAGQLPTGVGVMRRLALLHRYKASMPN